MSDDIWKKIVERARWAPSGDNCQPWSFEPLSESRLRIHVFHDRDNVYEGTTGNPSWIAAGALVENIRLAAAIYDKSVALDDVHGFEDGKGYVDISLGGGGVSADPLEKYIERRTVTRVAFSVADIPPEVRRDLEQAIGDKFTLVWHTGWKGKLAIIRQNMIGTDIRLSIPSAFSVHTKIIEWNKRFSEDRIPAEALGFSKPSLILVKWIMQSWARVNFMNRYLAGTLLPRLELDFLPGICCARHFTICLKGVGDDVHIRDLLDGGAAVQRFWLCATRHGLLLQPGMAPLIFAGYAEAGASFSDDQSIALKAETLLRMIQQNVPTPFRKKIFQGRIGYPRKGFRPVGRSIRKNVPALMVSE